MPSLLIFKNINGIHARHKFTRFFRLWRNPARGGGQASALGQTMRSLLGFDYTLFKAENLKLFHS